jgi:hypothetical protein
MSQYRFTQAQNFEAFASGRVFYARPGQPAFPARLASEVFQRALWHWRAAGGLGPCRLYDPVCGGAYWLAVLGFLHREEIAAIYASDVDGEALALAARNLALLTPAGLERRIAEIEQMLAQFGKPSHAGALESALQLRQGRAARLGQQALVPRIFQADAADPAQIRQGLGGQPVDIVLADVPYGWHSNWQSGGDSGKSSPLWQMLAALRTALPAQTLLAIAADKGQKIYHEDYLRLEKFQLGRRRIELLRVKTDE